MCSSLDSEVLLELLPNNLDAKTHGYRDILESDSRSLIDRYIEGELGIHVHLRVRNKVANLEAREFVLVFENAVVGCEVAVLKGHPFSSRKNDPQISFDNCGADEVQLAMPVHSRPIVQDHQRRADIPHLVFVASGNTSVRLYGFDKIPDLLRDDFLHAPHGLFEFGGIGSEDKFPLLFIGGRVLFELQNGGIVNTRVQCASELIQHLSKLERERQKPIALNCTDEEFPIPVVVYLGLRSVNLVCVEIVPYLNERLAVELRPRNTLPARIEW